MKDWPTTYRKRPWWKRKLEMALWRLGNPDLKFAAWRRRRKVLGHIERYWKEHGDS